MTFTATVTPNSDKLSYEWNFTGGTKTEDKSASPTHTYTKKGTYSVNLQVRDDDGSYGRAATTSVNVGSPPKPTPTPTPTAGTGGTRRRRRWRGWRRRIRPALHPQRHEHPTVGRRPAVRPAGRADHAHR